MPVSPPRVPNRKPEQLRPPHTGTQAPATRPALHVTAASQPSRALLHTRGLRGRLWQRCFSSSPPSISGGCTRFGVDFRSIRTRWAIWACRHATNILRDAGLREFVEVVQTEHQFGPLVPVLTVAPYLVLGKSIMVGFSMQVGFFALLGLATYGIARRLTSPAGGVLAAVVVCSIPAVSDYSRTYHLVLGSTALFTSAIYALLQSDGLRRRNWSVVSGILVGLTVLARTMMPAFVPSLVVSALVLAVLRPGHRRARLTNLGLWAFSAVATASVWYAENWRYVYEYLTGFGYGSQSAQYGTPHSRFSWEYWTAEGRIVAERSLYAPLSLALLVCLLGGVGALFVMHRRRWKQALTEFVRSDAVVPTLVVLEGYLMLTSSQNDGTGFWVPLVPSLAILCIAALWHVRGEPPAPCSRRLSSVCRRSTSS